MSSTGPSPPLAGLLARRLPGIRVAAGIVALAGVIFGLFCLLVVLGSANPFDAIRGIVDGAFGNDQVLGETLIRFAPLAIIAAALVPSLRAGLFNIGAPGQIGMGALAAGMVSLHLSSLPGGLLIILAGLAAAAAGALWAIVPAVMRARLGINEILSTLVFNFLASGILAYLLAGPLQGAGANIPQSDPLPDRVALPLLIEGTRAHIGVVIAIVAVVVLAFFGATPSGYRLRLFSGSPKLATRVGVHEQRLIITTICLGAAGAGLAGWMQALGVDHLVYANVADLVGYTGLFVALLGGLSAVGVLLAAFLFGALLQGGNQLQLAIGIPPEIIAAVIGMIVLGVALVQSRGSSGGAR